MDYLEHANLDVTKDIEEYAREEFMKNKEFLIVRSDGIGYCTRCKNQSEDNYISHNEYTTCEHCRGSVQVKWERYGRRSIRNRGLVYSFEKLKGYEEVLVCKVFMIIRQDYTDYKNMKSEYELEAIYFFDKKDSCMYTNEYSGIGKRCSIFDVGNIRRGPFGSRHEAYIDMESFKRSVKGTRLESCKLDEIVAESEKNPVDLMLKYLDVYGKNQLIESLVKIGFKKIIAGKIEGDSLYYTCNWKGRNIYKILKLSKVELREITRRGKDIDAATLKIFQIAKKQKSKMSLEKIEDLALRLGYRIFTLEKILEIVKIDKLARYFEKQMEIEHGVYGTFGMILNTYNDYIEDLKSLGVELGERVLWPKNLMEEHNRTTQEIKYRKDKELSKKIMKRRKELKEYNFAIDGFILRAVRSYKEIITEGKILGHCVGGYARKHADKETTILVIREVADTTKPFYTVEIDVKNKIIIQVRGKSNREMTEEVQAFIEKFKIEKLTKKKSKQKVIKIA